MQSVYQHYQAIYDFCKTILEEFGPQLPLKDVRLIYTIQKACLREMIRDQEAQGSGAVGPDTSG